MGQLSTTALAAVRKDLAALHSPVQLLLFSQTIGPCSSSGQMKELALELATLSPWLSVTEAQPGLQGTIEPPKIGDTTILGVVSERPSGQAGAGDRPFWFVGRPDGLEIGCLIEAIALAGGLRPPVGPEIVARIARVSEPVDLKVFVTPTCVYCPQTVKVALRLCSVSNLFTMSCINALECVDLAEAYQVSGVPMVVRNDSLRVFGLITEQDLDAAILGLVG